jgi:hypothetical protein
VTDEVFTEGNEGTTATAEAEPFTTEQMLQQLLTAQQEHRAEVAALRQEINAAKRPVPSLPAVQKSPEQLHEERIAELREFSHYCPGCGKGSKYMRECTGRAEAPHQVIEMVSTAEVLGDDPSQHTPAPDTTNLG